MWQKKHHNFALLLEYFRFCFRDGYEQPMVSEKEKLENFDIFMYQNYTISFSVILNKEANVRGNGKRAPITGCDTIDYVALDISSFLTIICRLYEFFVEAVSTCAVPVLYFVEVKLSWYQLVYILLTFLVRLLLQSACVRRILQPRLSLTPSRKACHPLTFTQIIMQLL